MLRVCRPSLHLLGHTKVLTACHGQSAFARHFASTAGLPETAAVLHNLGNGAEIHLVGTAHVSKASSEEVRDIIHAVQPQTVFVELDAQRAQQLRGGMEDQNNLKEFFKNIVSGYGLNIPTELLKQGLRGFYKAMKSMGMDPGLEFKVALEEAEKLNARIVYGDQEQGITVQNLASALSFKDVLKLMTGQGMQLDSEITEALELSDKSGVSASVEALKTKKAAEAMTAALRQFNPKLAKALIDDRDEFMVRSLRKLEGKVVGVVGLGHLAGMQKRWEQLEKQQQRLRTSMPISG
ncbi:hypothetical protein WJX79_009281 [Trebouxia sp. C0005]